MDVYISAAAQRIYDKTNEPDTSRLDKIFFKLSQEPPQGDIKRLEGQRDKYRARFGGWRILFRIDRNYINPETGAKGAIIVTEIGTRGGIYKGA